MRRDGDASLHVGDARADAAVADDVEGALGRRSHREDRVVVAEERDPRRPVSLDSRVEIRAGLGRDELGRQPVLLDPLGDQAGHPVECLERSARRVDAHPLGQVPEQDVEVVRHSGGDPCRLGGRDLGQSRGQPHQREAISAIVIAVSRVEAMSTHSSIPWIDPALGP